jgi:hypothetical protein
MELMVEACQKSFWMPFCHLSMEASDDTLLVFPAAWTDFERFAGSSFCWFDTYRFIFFRNLEKNI